MNEETAALLWYKRLQAFIRRHFILSHLFLLLLSCFFLYLCYHLPSVNMCLQKCFALQPRPEKSLLYEFFMFLTIALARIFPLDGSLHFDILASSFYSVCFLFLIYPHIVFWVYRRDKPRIAFLLLASAIMNVIMIYLSGYYSIWSFHQVNRLSGTVLPKTVLFEQCGYPIYWHIGNSNWTSAVYTDGFVSKVVEFDENGQAHVNVVNGLWLD